MSQTFTSLPGTLSLQFIQGDEFEVSLDFSISLVSYTITADIVSVVTGEVVLSPSVTVENAATGQVSVSLTESQTGSLPVGTYKWRMRWTAPGNVDRTALTGFVEVKS